MLSLITFTAYFTSHVPAFLRPRFTSVIVTAPPVSTPLTADDLRHFIQEKEVNTSSQLCLAIIAIWMTQGTNAKPFEENEAKRLIEESRHKGHKTPEELIRHLFGEKTNIRVLLKANILVHIATAHKEQDVDREAFIHILTECPLDYHATTIARAFASEFEKKTGICPFPDFTIRDAP